MNKNDELLKALSQLKSDESKAYFTFALLQNGVLKLSRPEILKHCYTFCKANKHLDAARFAKLAGDDNLASSCYEDAINNLEKIGSLTLAADIAKEAGMLERAMTNHAKAGNTLEAGRIAEESNNLEKASQLYETAGQVFDAFRTARDTKQHERAANIWDKAGKPEQGAIHAKKYGLFELADRLYKKAISRLADAQNPTVEDYNDAAFIAKEAGWNEQAFEFYERAIRAAGSKDERKRMFNQAIRLCEETSQPQRAEAYKMMQKLLG